MNNFIDLLKKGKTQFHVVSECKRHLTEHGFEALDMNSDWKLLPAGRYFVSPFSSMLIAFVIGESPSCIRFAAAHTDFPMLKLKSNPEITKKGYVQVNVEPYGGLITQTWFDRPLGLAGKIITSGEDAFSPNALLFDSNKPIFIIPNLAPHLKKNSSTQEIDVQRELIPVMTCLSSLNLQDSSGKLKESVPEGFLLDYIAGEMNINRDDILDYDLYLYVYAEPSLAGLKDEFVTGARIDNISSVSAIMEALCSDNINNCIAVGAFFDNEEIGSRSKQGADSLLLKEIVDRIIPDRKLLGNAFNMSVDVAHATHPNYMDKSDVTNDVILGNGVVLKTSAGQKYVTDSEAGAVITALSREKNINIQRQVNRSGIVGGQTLGPIMSAYLPVKSVDVGIPMLAMHSACELIHKADYIELVKLLTEYYEY